MSTRTSRSRKGVGESSTAVQQPTPTRSTRSRRHVEEEEPEDIDRGVVDEDAEGEAEEGDDGMDGASDLTPEPNLSSPAARGNARRRGRGGVARGRGRGGRAVQSRERTGTGTADEGDEGGKSLRLRKSVSYREIPVESFEDEEEEEEEEEEDAEGEDIDAGDEPTQAPTPRARLRTSEQPAASPSRREFEKIGSGRGGFSVKGAAAAAARARWAKYRSDKAERGEDSDADRPRRRTTGGGAAARRDKVTSDKLAEGSTYDIKGKEYIVGDDELILDDDEKGDLKVDADGALLGGREYRLVTFTSETRKNPSRVYALTIDAARACGYTDSLAFLRRCPQIIKLQCNADERQMLIDINRVTGNLKNRMVTMVSMRNVFKLMGARVVKDGKWVTDDYYEDKSLTECTESGFVPYAPINEEEILANALAHMAPQGRPAANPTAREDTGIPRAVMNLAPTYTLGGPTTQFGGSGSDPWCEAGWGHKRSRLKNMGVTEEDWMYRLAAEARAVDEQLKGYRDERLGRLEGRDLEGWVYSLQKVAEGVNGIKGGSASRGGTIDRGVKEEREKTVEWLKPPVPERRRSGLSQEVVPEQDDEPLTEISGPAGLDRVEGDADMAEEGDSQSQSQPQLAKPVGGDIIVQSRVDEAKQKAEYDWGVGSWEPGVVRGIIEPHTHVPHIPQHTQPILSNTSRLSQHPLIASLPDSTYTNHVQTSLSGLGARGLASVEYVFGASYPSYNGMYGVGELGEIQSEDEYAFRMQVVREAEEWEREHKRRKTEIA